MPRVDPSLKPFHPIVRRWFTERLGAPSAPQREGWPAIARGEHTLVLAPTGTGKTMAAFLWELNALVVEAEREPLPNAVHLLYVSPLKALGNDVHRNLEHPLAEIRAAFAAAGRTVPEIRAAVRTGDTPPSERARMIRKSPHILLTTPESLHILLTSERARTMFSHLRTVIVDEIHALAGGKRGAHLALTLERLELMTRARPQRIGLSATQRPLEEVARFLGGLEDERQGEGGGRGRTASAQGAGEGMGRTAPGALISPPGVVLPVPSPSPLRFRPVTIVDCGAVKKTELRVESPQASLHADEGSVWPSIARLAVRHARTARTTLVFVNNRGQAEKMAARMNAHAGEEIAQPYHGSIARERRLALEETLKAGGLRALVTTSALELGIDVGSVDLVLQLQSPKRVSAGLQRLGRAGHTLDATSRGVFIPTHREDALEMAVIVEAMREGDVERTRVVQNALDVLAQVLVAAASVDEWKADDLFTLVRRAYPFHRLPRSAFDEVLAMLGGKYASDLAASLEPRLVWDKVGDNVRAPRSSRLAAVTAGGTIPDRGLYAVYLGDRTRLGELDEEFVHESRVGDAFQLGSSTWRISAIEHDRVTVAPAPGAPAKTPFWHGEFMARDVRLAPRVGRLRRTLADARTLGDLAAISAHYSCDEATAQELAEYVAAMRAATGTVPDERTLLLEHYRDETGSVRLVLHSPFGGRVHAPWGMALAQRLREALGEGAEIQVQTGDDGILFRLPDLTREPPFAALLDLSPAEAEQRILDEVGGTSLFGARFRMAAARALVLARGAPKRRMPLWLQRLKALDLLEAVRAHPGFPLVVETYREILQDAFDIDGLREVLGALARGEIAVRTARTEVASPFAHSLEFGFVIDNMYGDDTPRAGQRSLAATLDRDMLDEVLGDEPRDDGTRATLAQVVAERQGRAPGRRARSADELAMILERAGDLTLVELALRLAPPEEGGRGDALAELLEAHRAVGIVTTAGEGEGVGRTASVPLPTPSPSPRRLRIIPTEHYARWLAAEGEAALATVHAGVGLEARPAATVVPDALRHATLTRGAARREILARHVADHGPVTVTEVVARYGWRAEWVEQRLGEWQKSGRLVRGVFRRAVAEPEWCARRLVDVARRRTLEALRRSVHAVPLAAYASFLQRWQRLDPRDQAEGREGTGDVLEQLAGVARPAGAWERDYLPARIAGYDPSWLGGACAAGQVAWIGERIPDGAEGSARAAVRGSRSPSRALARVRFVERGTAALWLREPPADPATLSADAQAMLAALVQHGASFMADLEAATRLGPLAMHEALRELVAAGLVTNDTADALREVLRTPALPGRTAAGTAGAMDDPARWLPAGFTPTPNRPVVSRRPNPRRLPRWRRPDLDTATAGRGASWTGRWTLARTPGMLGPERDEGEGAAMIAATWLARWGVVSRDWWRRERPAIGWRAIYRELKRLEMRGDVRRGYFVEGLAGAQFALPEVVDRLRAAADDEEAPVIAMAASDPANVHAMLLEPGATRGPLGRPRGAGGIGVTRRGQVLLAAEARGRRVRLAPGLDATIVGAAAAALVRHLTRAPSVVRARRDLAIATIDGEPAAASAHAAAFLEAGFRRGTTGLRWLA